MTIGSIGEQAYTGGISGMYGIDGEQTVSESKGSRTAGEVPPAGTLGADYDSKTPLNPPAGSYSSDSLSSANGACASFFGSVLALIQEMASDLVRDNRQIAYDSQMMAADSMESQADKMRDKAVVGLVTGVIQGAFQIAGGAVQFGMSVKGLNDISKMSSSAGKAADAVDDAASSASKAADAVDDAASSASKTADAVDDAVASAGKAADATQDAAASAGKAADAVEDTAEAAAGKDNLLTRAFKALTDKETGERAGSYLQNLANLGTAVGQMTQGVGTLTSGIGTYFTTMMDAEIKNMEADQKRMEAFADQIKSINESFRQTVQSAIETSRTISQGMVETNKRILA